MAKKNGTKLSLGIEERGNTMTKLLFVDTETGGLEPGKHSLLSVAVGAWENGKLIDAEEYHIEEKEYVVTQRALEINDIDLRRKRDGYSQAEVKSQIIGFIRHHYGNEKAVVVGQNVHFDIGFLTALFTKDDYEKYFSHRTIDTASIMRFLQLAGIADFGGSGLSDALKYFKINPPEGSRHTAIGDVFATAAVFARLLEITKGRVDV